MLTCDQAIEVYWELPNLVVNLCFGHQGNVRVVRDN